jgi:uncharacterized membrane protein
MSSISIRRPPAAQGLAWIKQGWSLFKAYPIPWSGMTALVFLVLMGVGFLPGVGGLLVHVLSPFIVAAYLAASRAEEQGEPVTFLYLGAGFRQGRNSLLLIGLAYMLATLLVFRLVALLTGGDMSAILAQIQQPHGLSPEEAEALLNGVLPAMGLGSLLLTPLLMATWFSPGLAHFEGFAPVKAMWWSLWACAVNWRPILYYSLILGLAGVVAVLIPFGLGLLVFVPWTLTSTYAAYRDIFVPMEAQAA